MKESIDNLHGIAGSEIAETKCMVELARTCLLLKDYARARSLTEEALKLSESLPRELVDMIRADGLRLLEDLDDTLRPPTKEK